MKSFEVQKLKELIRDTRAQIGELKEQKEIFIGKHKQRLFEFDKAISDAEQHLHGWTNMLELITGVKSQ